MYLLYYMPFLKNGTKPLQYSKYPYGKEEEYEEYIKEKEEQKKQPTSQERENERLKAIVFFSNWEKATKKQFKK